MSDLSVSTSPSVPCLRNYQQESLDRADAAFAEGARAVLVCLPTGAGKGLLAAWVARRAVEQGQRVLFVVHRRELVLDLKERLARLGLDRVHVLLGDEPEGDPDAPITLASIQALTARKSRPPADLLLTDEAHHAVAHSYGALYEAYPEARHLGLTATPQRADGTTLGDVFQKLVQVISTPELIAQGHLVPCDVFAPDRPWHALASPPIEALRRHAPGKRAVVFCGSVAHAHALAAELNAAGLPAAPVDGRMGHDERAEVLARWARGELQVVTNVYVLTEGFDLPALEVCVLARGCSSQAMFLQMVGRVLRPSPATGKERALLIDLQGVIYQHGLPTDHRTFRLDGRPITVETEGELGACPSCGVMTRTPLCARCQAAQAHPRARRSSEVDPIELQRIAFDTSDEGKKAYLALQARRQQQRGYKPGWVAYRFRERFGHWPDRAWWPPPAKGAEAGSPGRRSTGETC